MYFETNRLMSELYYEGRQVEILSLTALDLEKNFAFITLITEQARKELLTNALTLYREKLKLSIMRDKDGGNLLEHQISMIFVANNLPQREL